MSGASDLGDSEGAPSGSGPGIDMPVRAAARRALLEGRVPVQEPARTWGGSGTGSRCCICGRPVKRDQLGFELEFVLDDPGSIRHLHVRCFEAWESERLALPRTPLSTPPGDGKISDDEPGHVNGRGPQG